MAQHRETLIAGNWKMNGSPESSSALAKAVADGHVTPGPKVLVCPPSPLLSLVLDAVKESSISVGAQTCHSAVSGAHTGDVSAEMVAALGCSHVIVGHSERRQDHGETDALVADQAAAAHRAGLIAIICVGETEAEREAGQTNAVIAKQVTGSLPASAAAENTVIAYEPVWAIGTGKTPTAEDANDVHAEIRRILTTSVSKDFAETVQILYGGSMKPANAAELLAQPDIDGGLIGGASLKAEDFLAIAAAATG